MRRLLSSLLLALVATMFLAVFAMPGFATETEVPAETTEGEGQWTGLIASFVAGILMGGIGFFSAGTEGLDGHGDDH